MRRRPSRRGLVSLLALAAPLILSSSSTVGSSPISSSAASRFVCQAGPTGPSLQEGVAQVRTTVALSGARTDVVTLNGRGYGYGTSPAGEMQSIQQELARERAAQGR